MEHNEKSAPAGGITRRNFIKGIGTAAVSTAAFGAHSMAEQLEKANKERIHGPDAVPVTLRINGVATRLNLEPRVTLLDALRNHSSHTGTKEVCDRATCGACTVLMDGNPVYSCSTVAIEAQGHEITTIEGLAEDGKLTRLQQSFVDKDGLMCGFCTSGFIMSLTALLKQNPNPTEAEIQKACSGNLCRCGTYPRIFAAAREAAGIKTADNIDVIPFDAI